MACNNQLAHMESAGLGKVAELSVWVYTSNTVGEICIVQDRDMYTFKLMEKGHFSTIVSLRFSKSIILIGLQFKESFI